MSRRMVAILIAAVPVFAAPSGATEAPATVELRPSVSVTGESLTLAQLAEIAPLERVEELGGIEIGPAPLPGGSRRLTRGYLKMRLRRSGLGCGEVALSGADAVEVTRASVPAAAGPQARHEADPVDPDGAPPADEARPRPAVDRGSRVRLTVICGAVSIGAEATLLEAAVVGEWARMRVEQTREIVVAQIVRPSEAVIRRE